MGARLSSELARSEATRHILPDEAQGNADARYVRPDGDLSLRRCAGNREAKSGTCDASGIGRDGSFAKQHRRFNAAGGQLLVDRLMAEVANLAGCFRIAVVIVPDAGRERRG